jgi:hypothetical protein
LVHDAAAATIHIERGTVKGGAFARQDVVIADGGEQDSAAIELPCGAGRGLPHVVFGRQVREGVVGDQNRIEWPARHGR